MIEGITNSGFTYHIDADVFDDWETLEIIRDVEDDASRTIDLARKLLTKEQLSELKEHCRDERNRVSMTRMFQELHDIMNQESKN